MDGHSLTRPCGAPTTQRQRSGVRSCGVRKGRLAEGGAWVRQRSTASHVVQGPMDAQDRGATIGRSPERLFSCLSCPPRTHAPPPDQLEEASYQPAPRGRRRQRFLSQGGQRISGGTTGGVLVVESSTASVGRSSVRACMQWRCSWRWPRTGRQRSSRLPQR